MRRPIIFFLMIIIVLMFAQTLQAQYTLGIAFNYQGQLKKNGSPQNGPCTFRFSLWDAPTGGVQQGNTKTMSGVNVANGFFTAQLDFGEVTGSARWLQIEVQCRGDSGFSLLSPRQALAGSAANTSTTPNETRSSNYIQNTTTQQANTNFNISGNGTIGGILSATNVGIGNITPQSTLHVNGTGWFAGDNTPLKGAPGKGVGMGYFRGNQDAGYVFAYDYSTGTGKNLALNTAGGNVGIGTFKPSEKFTVQTAADRYGLVQTDGEVVVGSKVGPGDSGTNGGWFGTRSDHPLRFFTSDGPARMTIGENGNLSIGNAPTLFRLTVRGPDASSDTIAFHVENSGGNAGFDVFDNGNVVIAGSLKLGQLEDGEPPGNHPLCRNSSFRIASCLIPSSLRYKQQVSSYSAGLRLISRLRPISFTWKTNGVRDLGLGAEDVAKVEPLLVTHDDKGEIEGVKYDRLNVVLINAIKEQQKEIEELRGQIRQLQVVSRRPQRRRG